MNVVDRQHRRWLFERYFDALYRFDFEFRNLERTGLDRFHAIKDAVAARHVRDDELPPFVRARL